MSKRKATVLKGEKVACQDLRQYLYGLELYRQASMLRKGREVHKIYVDVTKGLSFMDDRFGLTNFGQMVLESGSVRAGRARNVRQIVVARETLYCSGTTGCMRACGGHGQCSPDCDKAKVRGHKCSFRVKLTMRLGFVDHWFVEILGSHNAFKPGESPIASPSSSSSSATTSATTTTTTNPCSGTAMAGASGGGAGGENAEPTDLSLSGDSNCSDEAQSRISPMPDLAALLRQNGASAAAATAICEQYRSSPPVLYLSTASPLNIPVFPEPFSISAQHRHRQQAVAAAALLQHSQPQLSSLDLSLKPDHSAASSSSPRKGSGGRSGSGSLSSSSSPVSLVCRKATPTPPPPTPLLPPLSQSSSVSGHPLPPPPVAKNGHITPASMSKAVSERNELLKSYLNSSSSGKTNPSSAAVVVKNEPVKPNGDVSNSSTAAVASAADLSVKHSSSGSLVKQELSPKAATNGGGGSGDGDSGVASEDGKAPSQQDLSNKYWTYQFSTPELSPSPSPLNNGHHDKTMDVDDDDDDVAGGGGGGDIVDDNDDDEEENMLVIDEDDGALGGEGETNDNDDNDEEEDDKDLMSRVQQLEAHVTQLRHIILKGDKPGRKGRAQRQFDFNKYNTRHVALKIAYLGWDHQGFVVQEDTEKTIEAALFDALTKTRLVENRETSNYHRCGRTDKGVSAFGQVISLDLRTNLLKGPGVKIKEGGTAHQRQGETTTEIRYVHILNKVLPPEVRVLAWAPVDESFSARFSCKKRTYKYYFPRGNLDLQLLRQAAGKLVGEHDFRNLCKMDVGNGVVTFKRRIMHTEVAELQDGDNGYVMCELTVVGQAFLWHQIRCIVAVLFLIAQGKEEPEILEDLLNVEKCPRKPQYTMASELPLVLFDCDYGDELEWVYEADWHEDNIRHLQHMWAQHAIRATMLKRMLEELDHAKVETESDIAPWNELSAPVLQQCDWMLPGNKPRVYTPLLQRQTCESLEERIEHYAKRRKTAHPQSSAPATPSTSSS